jgi:hypothetical protein
MGARAVGDHGRARAGGAPALRPGLDRRPARQRGCDPGGVRDRDAARASRGGDPGRLHPRAHRASSGCSSSSSSARRCRAPCGSSTRPNLGQWRSRSPARCGCSPLGAYPGAAAASR